MNDKQEQDYTLEDENCQPTKCAQIPGSFYGVCPFCQLESSQHAVCPNKDKNNEV